MQQLMSGKEKTDDQERGREKQIYREKGWGKEIGVDILEN